MYKYIFFLLMLAIFTAHAEDPEIAFKAGDYKHAIALQNQLLQNSNENENRGPLLARLAFFFLKDQNQERAFETYLEALNEAKGIKKSSESKYDSAGYKKALAIYFQQSDQPETAAKCILEQFSSECTFSDHSLKDPLLTYLLAISYANLQQFEEFFPIFYEAYCICPDHFLALKTKGILHIKLLERKRLDLEREFHRTSAIKNFKLALEREPNDLSLYKLLLIFSEQEQKKELLYHCLNKILVDNIIIPRKDLFYYIEQAVEVNEQNLAKRFIERAKTWYPQSRIVAAAENYIETEAIQRP